MLKFLQRWGPLALMALGAIALAWAIYGAARAVVDEVEEALAPKVETVVVQDSSLLEEVRELRADRERHLSLIARLQTREVAPDTVFVAVDTLTQEDLREIPIAMVEVEKVGKDLTVTQVDHNTGEVKRLDYTLPRNDSDFELTAGGTDARLRVDREWGVRFGGTVRGNLGLVGSEWDGVQARPATSFEVDVRGPIQVGTEHITFAPWADAGTDGWRAGVSGEIKFGRQ